jgi:HTH-type transcriptional regulator, glycine betaine synthesis regulator
MKGYLWSDSQVERAQASTHWESVAVDAVGNVIEFWGFKRNQGRVWALLYLRNVALTAAEIEKEAKLSKGGVSMLLRDLERWGVIVRVRNPDDSSWRYQAEHDLLKMARKVIEERESHFISRIRADLSQARQLAEADTGTARDTVDRLKKMESLADATDRALKLFLKTSRLDLKSMFGVFKSNSLGAR